MTRRRWAQASLLALAALAACARRRTEIVLVVRSDLAIPAKLDQVQVLVFNARQERQFQHEYDLRQDPAAIPLSIGLIPGADKSAPFRAVATGLLGGRRIVERSAVTSFVPGQTLTLYLDLMQACAGLSCDAGKTCWPAERACQPEKVDPGTLGPVDPEDLHPVVDGSSGAPPIDGASAGQGGDAGNGGAGGQGGVAGNGGAGGQGGVAGSGGAGGQAPPPDAGADAALPAPDACVAENNPCLDRCGKLVDRCGKPVECGDCGPGLTCGGGGPNRCGPLPCQPNCTGKVCGDSDGCSGRCLAGSCGPGERCSAGACTCDPATCQGCCAASRCDVGTSNASCGSQGAQCLPCGAGQSCAAGKCTPTGPQALAPMPTARDSVGATLGGDGRIYVLGGSRGRSYSATMATAEAYDPAANRWSSLPSLPTGRYELRAAAGPGSKLYAIGGYGGGRFQTVVEEYSIATNGWRARMPLPTARTGYGLVAGKDGLIYAIGGWTGQATAANEVYDPVADSWAARAPLPVARDAVAAALGSDGQIYIIGHGGGHLVEAYDPATNQWTRRADMPTGRSHAGAATGADGKLYVIGGAPSLTTPPLTTVEAYDPASNLWIARAPMPTARSDLAVVAAANGRIYAIGGYDGTGSLSMVEAYDPGTDRWSR